MLAPLVEQLEAYQAYCLEICRPSPTTTHYLLPL